MLLLLSMSTQAETMSIHVGIIELGLALFRRSFTGYLAVPILLGLVLWVVTLSFFGYLPNKR